MKAQAFSFEIKDLLIQFVAAFDDIIIKRYNENREEVSKVQVRYLYSPKQRVLYDIVNRSQNLTLPVVAVSINGVSRDNERVFNKLAGFYINKTTSETDRGFTSSYLRTPVPVNISINMSIVAKYQSDMDQILSNFVPFNNPYIIISWTVPKEFNLPYTQEIRSEVLWNGNIALNYPTDINGNQKAQIIADTSFTIKGWMFPDPESPIKNIFKVDTNMTAVSTGTSLEYGSYTFLRSQAISTSDPISGSFGNSENITVSGHPAFSEIRLYTPFGPEL